MSKFTQGPWVAKGGEVCTEDYEAEGQIMHDHICCCEVVNGESPNAKLIAAAPELLEALQLIIKDLRIRAKVRGDIDDDGTVVLDIGSGVLMKANDAIAKALGQ